MKPKHRCEHRPFFPPTVFQSPTHHPTLPPKLAVMMLNLAQVPDGGTVLDPFCGSGTILTEAMLLGCTKLIGADISEKAIEDSQKNIQWIQQWQFITPPSEGGAQGGVGTESPITLFQSDIKNLSQKIPPSSVDSIVTEPYLGKPLKGHETAEEIEAQALELKQLYLAAFKEFYNVLKPDGRVVFIIPRFKIRNDWKRIDCIEDIKKLGFSVIPLLPDHDSLLYARPDQRVGREIWRFEKR